MRLSVTILILAFTLALALCPLAHAAPFRPVCGTQAYEEQCIMPLIVKYGGACWPLDDPSITSGPLAGVSRELTGVYPGTQSGTFYYNSVTVAGTLSPNATGTYTAGGTHNSAPYFRRASDNWYLFKHTNSYWYITTTLGSDAGAIWQGPLIVPGSYTPGGGATGTATVANVTASGIYLFVPSGVTMQSTGPIVSGETAKAAAFDGSTGSINCNFVSDASGAITVFGWVNCTNAASNPYMFGLRYSVNSRFSIRILTGSVRTSFYDGATTYSCSSGAISGWAFVVSTKAAGNVAPVLYIDGVVKTGTSAAGFSGAVGMYFAGLNATTSLMQGSLAYCTVIPAALSANEVLSIYNAATKGL